MTEKQEMETLRDAIFHFGINHQSTKAIEEMSELIKEICKNKDGLNNVSQIAEEIADVLITIDQLIMHFNIYEDVAWYRNEKMERLYALIYQGDGT